MTLGLGGLAISNANIQAAITGISGWPAGGTVTSSGAGNTGFTATFGGTLANSQVSLISIVNCTGSCTSTVRENSRGSAGVLGIAGGTVTVGTVADTGYNVTFNALGDVSQLSVTNPSAGVGGSVSTTTNGTSGILPVGATATVAGFGAGTFNNTGFQVTFGGSLAGQATGALTLTNLSSGVSGYVNETAHGGPAPYNKGFQQIATGDTAPSVTAPAGPLTIPYRTPFALTGSGSDPDGDATTFMWEQFDRGGTTGTALTTANKTNGPLFREFGTALDANAYNVHGYGSASCSNGENCVNTNPTRVFPDMAQILANDTNANTGDCPGAPAPGSPPVPQALVDCYSEFLPTASYPGPMHFILTARDGIGGRAETPLVTVNLAPGTGPFLVTAPNTAVTLDGGTNTNVTWNVAGTDAPPISTSSVNILLSTDGGQTFPTVLASGVPNNGSANVALPNVATTHARIEIQAVGNIYFDVSDSDFTMLQTQTISFDPIAAHTWGDADFNVSAVSSSGLPVTFTVGASDQCTITGTLVHITGAGSCSVTAHQAGNATTEPAPDVTQTFAINKADQTISFTVADHTFGDSDFTINATSTSGLDVSFAVISGHCTVTGNTVHITGAGNCTVEASQAGDSNYNAAPPVDRTFNINQASQTITFPSIPNKTFGTGNFTLSASASSGLPVSYAASGDCSVSGSTVHLTGAGSCTITASQPGDADYNPASDVMRTFSIAKGNQFITFPTIPKTAFGSPDLDPGATANSGLSITYTASGVCHLVSGLLHLDGVGRCTVKASQVGDPDWNAAIDVTRKFNVTAAPTTTSLSGTSPVAPGGQITLIATISSAAGGPTDGNVQFSTTGGTLLATIPVSAGSATAFVTAPGSPTKVQIKAKYVPGPASDWKGSTSAKVVIQVHN